MLDGVKDYLTPKTFSIPAYVCLIAQLLCGLVVTSIVVALRVGEFAKFNCAVGPESAASYKNTVEKTCYSRYEEKYNSPLPFYAFVILSIWFPIFVGVIYSLSVHNRVKEISGSNDEPQNDAEAGNEVHNRRSFYVFYFYFFHLVIRLLLGLVFTILQYAVFFRSGFDFEFSCDQRASDVTSKIAKNASQLNSTTSTITCENSTASEKKLWAEIVCALNTIFAAIIFVEVIYVCLRFSRNLRFWSEDGHVQDTDFIAVHFSQKRYTHVGFKLTKFECVDSYKRRVLEQSRTPDVIYGPKTGLDDLFIDVVIHTELAPHHFPTNMDRHEIFDVYMKVPDDSIRLEKVKDLFYPNKDTKGKHSRKILAVGRPGIGKTVLTEKIMRDWANEVDEFYSGKIAFYFKFRWFNLDKWKGNDLKTFLRCGTRLSDEEFERIFDYITKKPKKALLIFDGLDEFDGNIKDCLDHLPRQNNRDIRMPAISLFIKLISGHFLPGATILVTTRPTASDFYSRLKFDRNVEIIGFTSEKIEHYVSKFCENHEKSYLKPKMWKHIESSSDLLNLCYIPVNSFIVSAVLFGYLTDPRNETAVLPTTLTEVYQAAIKHFDKYHYRKTDGPSSEASKNLQLKAYDGIEDGQLVFNEESIDEEMRRSGLLNKFPNPIHSGIQEQFCFIHLTVQEFLAAKHVTETQSPEEIKNFISSKVKDGKWHLVLQFIAGILGQKKKTLREQYQRYKDCVLAFTESFRVNDGELDICEDYGSLFVMKCLKEAGDEDIVKEACERTAMKDVVRLSVSAHNSQRLSSSDLAAVIYVCKHMKKLTDIHVEDIDWSEECYMEICKFLQQRCMRKLKLVKSGEYPALPLGGLFKSLIKLKCTTLDHKHSKLAWLYLQGFHITDECLSMILDFLKHGHASCLKILTLNASGITSSEITKIGEVLDNKLCPEADNTGTFVSINA
ncbi:NACHT, LRR and PYD domains-containing protein 3-like [Dendronephthya gigantea]|uniref:NACHT, LRR and PYD domains-containing protein 3-like n=1 Tax=Dendronephthya gigantea TaxID=151771 RepID=UPI00106AB11E|nr:NACHT, LRR and PYD domains-containing protein 3-like [Dendronephthya gigantea]